MKKHTSVVGGPRRLRLVALVAAAVAALAAGGAHAQAAEAGWAPGRLILMPRAGLGDAELARLVAAHGGKARRLGRSTIHVVELARGAPETVVAELLGRHPHLKFAELDRRVAIDGAANDPYAGSEWHLGKIRVPAAWDRSQGSGITIAIADTGVMPTHPDLVERLVPGWNFVDRNADSADVHGHGTAVAGAAAATLNNALGVAGVAGQARIMPLRVADSSGYAYYSTIADAVVWAADRGARVANASFSGVYASSAIQSAGQYLKGKGGLLVVAAGNSGANDGAPATSAMIPVSATDGSDALASWSSWGSYVALAAPGVGIWTTHWDGAYGAWSGTSFASPISAGVVALMMAANPALPASQVESLLYANADDLGAAGRDPYYGWGRVNAERAVAAAATATAADTQPPTVAVASPAGGTTVAGIVAVDVAARDNVGVARVELRVNGVAVGTDTSSPYQFAWDSSKLGNGSATLVATAWDAAGNSAASKSVGVTVANPVAVDTTPPVVAITNPAAGRKVSGTVQVTTSASDDAGAAGIRQSLYVDGRLVASATGSALSYSWNTRKAAAGTHVLTAVARDAAGNSASTTVQVSK